MADNLSADLQKKLKECKTVEELVAVASDAGVELPDEVLQSVAGGKLYGEDECPAWRSCEYYCKTYDASGECTWVVLPFYSGHTLTCESYTS